MPAATRTLPTIDVDPDTTVIVCNTAPVAGSTLRTVPFEPPRNRCVPSWQMLVALSGNEAATVSVVGSILTTRPL